jgi:hypothetical protein
LLFCLISYSFQSDGQVPVTYGISFLIGVLAPLPPVYKSI